MRQLQNISKFKDIKNRSQYSVQPVQPAQRVQSVQVASDSFKFDDRFVGRRTNKVLVRKPQRKFDQFVHFQSELTSDDSIEILRLANQKDHLLDEFQIDSKQLQVNHKNQKRSSVLWDYIQNFPQNKMNSNFMLDLDQNSEEYNDTQISQNIYQEDFYEQNQMKPCQTSKKGSKVSKVQTLTEQNDKVTKHSKNQHIIPAAIEQIQSKSSILQPQHKDKIKINPKPKRIRFNIQQKQKRKRDAEQQGRVSLQFRPFVQPDQPEQQLIGQTSFRRRTRMETLRFWLGQRRQYKKGKLVGTWVQKKEKNEDKMNGDN